LGTIEISGLIAIIGCAIGVLGWLSGKDKQATNDGHWRGTVDTKLDDIKSSVGETGRQIAGLSTKIDNHADRIRAVEESTKSAHKRIDRLDNIIQPESEENHEN